MGRIIDMLSLDIVFVLSLSSIRVCRHLGILVYDICVWWTYSFVERIFMYHRLHIPFTFQNSRLSVRLSEV